MIIEILLTAFDPCKPTTPWFGGYRLAKFKPKIRLFNLGSGGCRRHDAHPVALKRLFGEQSG